MSEQVWNFAAIEGAAAEINGAVGTTQGLLDEGKASLAALASVWGGVASDSYQAVQARWDSTSADLNSALQNLASTVSEASSTMSQANDGIASMF